jgi:TonB family protein
MKRFSIYLYSMLIFGLLVSLPLELVSQKKLEDPINFGGKKEFKRIFEQELNYPKNSIEKDIGGKVMLEVKVDTGGRVLSTRVTESVGKEVDAEALRIAALLVWEPAHLKGENLPGIGHLKFKFNPFQYESIIMDRGFRLADYPKNAPTVLWDEDGLDVIPSIESRYGSFRDYVREELVFPEEAKAKEVNGYVEVFFIIEPNGRVTNVKLIQALEGNCDVVALDLIHGSRWIPGFQGGIPVRTIRREKIGFFSLNPNKALFHSGEQTPNR